MNRFIGGACALLIVSCGDGDLRRAYVPNAGDGTVSVLDLERLEAVDTLMVSEGPEASTAHGVAVGAGGERLFVGDSAAGRLLVLDTATHQRVGAIDLGIQVHGIDATPGGDRVVVSGSVLPDKDHKRTYVIDSRSLEVVGDIDTNLSGHGDCTPDGRYMYLNDIIGHRVAVIDLEENRMVTEILVGPENWEEGNVGPNEVAFAPDGQTAYSADYDSDTVSVLDTSVPTAPRVVATYAVGVRPHGISVTADGRGLWISNRGSRDLVLLDAATGEEQARVDLAPYEANHVALSEDGAQAWVTLTGTAETGDAGFIAVIDTSTLEEVARIPVGVTPHELSFEDGL